MVSGYRWANINTLPKLIGNENGFIDKALQSLRDDMDKQTIASSPDESHIHDERASKVV
jgi:hypothetical protein